MKPATDSGNSEGRKLGRSHRRSVPRYLAAGLLLPLVLTSALTIALADDPDVTHVTFETWQATNFHNPRNPGCSIGSDGSISGSRVILGGNRTHAEPMNLVVRRTGWLMPANTPVHADFMFSDGTDVTLNGTGKGDSATFEIGSTELATWISKLTSSRTMQIAVGDKEPRWTVDLSGAPYAVNAMVDCLRAHQITGVVALLSVPAASSQQSPSAENNSLRMPQSAPISALPAPTAQSPSGDKVLMEWAGSGRMQTRPFHIDGPWEFQWSRQEGYFSAWLHKAVGTGGDKLLANGAATDHSTFYYPQGGDFYLEINAQAPWQARIVSVSPTGAMVEPSAPSQAPMVTQSSDRFQAVNGPNGMPNDERAPIAAVQAARNQYETGANNMAKGAARPLRAQAICRYIRSPSISNWTGQITSLTTNGDGWGVIAVSIAPKLTLKSWNNALSDVADHTLIDPSSSVFKDASRLQVGQEVRFSAELIPSQTDCFEEGSVTLSGSINDPEFIIRLTSIEAAK